MSALTITLMKMIAQRIDMSPLSDFANKPLADILALELQYGNQKVPLRELFDVTGEPGDELMIKNSCDKLDHIGHKLSSGTIKVKGEAGAYCGMRMQQGTIIVDRGTDLFAGCEMKGGTLIIKGDAGDFLGAALPGDKAGMAGGTVIVKGNAGDRLGDQMRRGLIVVEGNAGDYCASRMIAGTIAVMGTTGKHLAYAMKRGTLLVWEKPDISSTFVDCGEHTLGFLPLMFNSFKNLDSKIAQPNEMFKRVQRFGGDMASLGRGEILVRIQ